MTGAAGAGGPVAFIDDDADLRRATAQMLTLAGYEVHAFEGAEAALSAIDAGFPGPVVSDIRIEGDGESQRLDTWQPLGIRILTRVAHLRR